MTLIVEPGDPTAPGPATLLRESHALMERMFPPEDNHYLSPDALKSPEIAFFVARDGGETLGTGALKNHGLYGEVKSMFVAESARGRGIANALLRQIEDHARALALPVIKLETGNTLHAAHRLYTRHGFTPCGPFSNYVANKTSAFMEKPLGDA